MLSCLIRQTNQTNAVDLLHGTALDYIDRWNRDERELAELFNLSIARPLPTLVTLGGMMAVTELLGQPQSASWQGLFIDADLRSVEVVTRNASDDNRLIDFMQISALQGSALEHQVLQDHFQVESISTVKLLALAQQQNIPLVTISAENLDAVLPSLALNPIVEEDITTAVAAGMLVQIPQQPVSLVRLERHRLSQAVRRDRCRRLHAFRCDCRRQHRARQSLLATAHAR